MLQNRKTPNSANRKNEEEMRETERGRKQMKNLQTEHTNRVPKSSVEFKLDRNAGMESPLVLKTRVLNQQSNLESSVIPEVTPGKL